MQPVVSKTTPDIHDSRGQPAALARRQLLAGGAAAAAGCLLAPSASAAEADDPNWKIQSGRINQSVVLWCYKPMDVETLARSAAKMGLTSVEIVEPEHWPILKKHGLMCAIAPSHGFVRGLNHLEHHAECIDKLTRAVEASAAGGCPNVITFSGMRGKLTDEEGIANTVAGLKKVIGLAESRRVNLCIEMLNSRVDVEMKGHPGYQCDRIEWAVEVCRKVASERMKILFDIYHVQIMQGDVITRIRQFKEYIGHYHTAGVPGRNELDDTQELNYRPIMQAIIETGYRGYVGQEFIPRSQDQIASLRAGVKLCDV